MADRRYVSTTETGKLMRAALKAAFPATKFSVAQHGRGSSLTVRWTDGPTVKRVEEITSGFGGKGFDGSIDLAYSIDTWLKDGKIVGTRCTGTAGSMGRVEPWGLEPPVEGAELVHFHAGYVNEERTISPALANRCIAQLCAYWGGVTEIPVAVPNGTWGGYKLEPAGISNRPPRPDLGGNCTGHYYDWSDLIHQAAGDATRYVRVPLLVEDPPPVPIAAEDVPPITLEELASQADGLLEPAAIKLPLRFLRLVN